MLTGEGPVTARQHEIPLMVTVYKPKYEGIDKYTPPVVLKENWQTILLKYGSRLEFWWNFTSAAETVTFYTVPVGKIYVISRACVSMAQSGTTDHVRFRLYVHLTGTGAFDILNLYLSNHVSEDNQTYDPSIPIIIREGEYIVGVNGDHVSCDAELSFWGYEIDKDTFYKLL